MTRKQKTIYDCQVNNIYWERFSSLMGNLCAQLFNIIFDNAGHCIEQSAFYGKMQEHFALSLCLT